MNQENENAGVWTLTLLHTNDAHGHLSPISISSPDLSSQLRFCHAMPANKQIGGFAYLAGMVEEIRKQNEHVLLVEAGDVFCDSELANLTKGQLHLHLMNELKYDAMVPGNHDVDYGINQLKKLASEATFPMLAANLVDSNSGNPLFGTPHLVKTIQHTKVALYGLAYHLTHETTSSKNIDGVTYTFDYNTIQRDITSLKRDGADIVIVLSHLGAALDRKLASEITGIDVIVGGHSHDPIPLEKVNDVLITQSTPYFTGLGVLKLQFTGQKLTDAEGKIYPIVPEKMQPHQKIHNMIQEARLTHKHQLEDIIGYTAAPIIRNYKTESPADTLFGNILREYTKSHISILPGSGFGVTIPPGPITKEQLTNLLPHQSSIYTILLKGKDILKALQQSIINQINSQVEERVGGLIQVTGLSFTYHYLSEYKSPIYNVMVQNTPLHPEHLYKVVVNQLMFEGGHKYGSLKNYQAVYKWEPKDFDIIANWLKLHHLPFVNQQGWSKPLLYEDGVRFQKKCLPR